MVECEKISIYGSSFQIINSLQVESCEIDIQVENVTIGYGQFISEDLRFEGRIFSFDRFLGILYNMSLLLEDLNVKNGILEWTKKTC